VSIDKAALLKGFIPTGDVDLPSGQGSVTVRGLSRMEATRVQKAYRGEDVDEAEVIILACGLVDPALTEAEARAWREVAAAGDVEAISQKISELSKLDDGGGKGPTTSSRSRRK
jgi:hypothetical protein